MLKLIHYAQQYKDLGLSVYPVDVYKHSIGSWKEFQERIMTDEEIKKAFAKQKAAGIAIICGKISGGLEVLDIDSKYDLEGDLFEQFVIKIDQANPNLITKLPVSSTKNNGYHFLYRTNNPCNYELLAKRNPTNEEKAIDPHSKSKTLIECLGSGRYSIEFPTEGYGFLQHDLTCIPFISESEKELIKKVARSFDQYKELKVVYRDRIIPYHSNAQSPLDDYNTKVTVQEIIDLFVYHNWSIVAQTRERTSFKRPGTPNHPISGNLHHATLVFIVYSPHTDFEPGQPYSPAAVFAFLECNKDFRLAAKRLLQMGYGVPYNQR